MCSANELPANGDDGALLFPDESPSNGDRCALTGVRRVPFGVDGALRLAFERELALLFAFARTSPGNRFGKEFCFRCGRCPLVALPLALDVDASSCERRRN